MHLKLTGMKRIKETESHLRNNSHIRGPSTGTACCLWPVYVSWLICSVSIEDSRQWSDWEPRFVREIDVRPSLDGTIVDS